ncbi:hypothetical protein [Flagellimonas meishanensis]|uniref:hypothetical protein n=1 Tax=Flagellimonas meishanensis TaxID=2873264 RepID=UPI001CA6E4B0|nr:hypothetical protein [[Muricauda] meishanensis]
MKTLLITLGFALASLINQDVEKMVGTYDGTDNGSFFFTDDEGDTLEFEQIEEEILEKFDLTSEAFMGRNFEISYITEIISDDDEEEIYISKIVNLKLLD